MAPSPTGIVALIAGLALFVVAWVFWRRHRAIVDTPLSKALAVAAGPVAVTGEVNLAPGTPEILGPFTGESAVFLKWTIEEERTRTVSDGKSTHVERYWVMIDHGEERPRMALRDESGTILVDPVSGHVPTPAYQEWDSGMWHEVPARIAEFATARGDATKGWFGFAKRMRFQEWRLPPATRLYIMGNATLREDAGDATGSDALVIQHKGPAPFVLSTDTEHRLATKVGIEFWAALLAGAALAIGGAYLLA
ncbi:MAG: GIDE domain-containing protein [Thermoplasmatota archaeon]